jgi:hypothetical protein
MNELKLYVDDGKTFEERLQSLGGVMDEPQWFGNWYLETSSERVLKVVLSGGMYSLLELRKLNTGYAFVGDTALSDTASLLLDEVAEHNVLHKIIRSWMVNGQSVDVLVFDDIGVFACVNYEDGKIQDAIDFIHTRLGLHAPRYLELPFNVLKRRRLGLPDFDHAR